MKPGNEKRLKKLEREIAQIRKLLPKKSPLPAVENPQVFVHRSPIKRIDQRKFK